MSSDLKTDALVDIDLPLPDRRDGKVRVSYAWGDDQRLFVTTDRLSAFDRILAGVPYKGQVLNQLAAWWFARTADVVANHVVAVPDPNLLIARSATTLPVEVVVRGYITGVTSTSLWKPYSQGARHVYGHDLPDGLGKNERLPEPLYATATYQHGKIDLDYFEAQHRLTQLQGEHGLWLAGLYTDDADSHESAIRSAISVGRGLAPGSARLRLLTATS